MPTHTIKHNSKLLKRVFGGLPVVDAKRELRVFAARGDINNGIRKDPTNCVFAKACRRLYGSNVVAFFRTVTYMELPDSNGNPRIERFINSKPTRSSIAKYDRTGKLDPAGYHLLPPSRGQTMNARLERDRVYRATKIKNLTPIKKRKKLGNKIALEVRNGKGLVQFIGGPKDWMRSA